MVLTKEKSWKAYIQSSLYYTHIFWSCIHLFSQNHVSPKASVVEWGFVTQRVIFLDTASGLSSHVSTELHQMKL